MVEEPLADAVPAWQDAVALEVRTEAVMYTPAAVRVTLATDAAESVRWLAPLVLALRRSRSSRPGMLAWANSTDRDPPELGSGPVSSREIFASPNTFALTTAASPV